MTDPGGFLGIGLLLLMVFSAGAALLMRDLLAATAFFGVFSFAAATWFAFLGAVDVAFTEACVGGALSTILLVSTAFRGRRRLD